MKHAVTQSPAKPTPSKSSGAYETLALKWHGSLRESQYTHVLVTEDTFKHRSVFSGETTLMLQVLLVPVKRSKVKLLVPVKRSKVELLVPVKGQRLNCLYL